MHWNIRGTTIDLSQPVVMGILNTSPDSFSGDDSGQAVGLGESMLSTGARILDIGGESTRPGFKPIDEDTEWKRSSQLFVTFQGTAILSVDTTKAFVAHAALTYGARIVNDVNEGRNADLLQHVADFQAGYVLMRNPRINPPIPGKDPLEDLLQFFSEGLGRLARFGIEEEQVVLDPGIGFGWHQKETLELLRYGSVIEERMGRPVLIGASRKSFIGALTGRETPAERIGGSVAAALIAIQNGARIIRAHDVRETVDAIKMWKCI